MSPVLKKKPEKKKIPGKYLLLIVTVLCLGLMLVTFTTNISDSFLNSSVGVVVIPFQKGIVNVSSKLFDYAQKQKTIEELQAENERLKAEVDSLTSENTLLMQDYYELTSLRQLYDLDQTYSVVRFLLGARITAAES